MIDCTQKHLEFGDDAKDAITRVGTMIYQLEVGGRMEVKDVVWVLELKWSFLSISMMEKKGFHRLSCCFPGWEGIDQT